MVGEAWLGEIFLVAVTKLQAPLGESPNGGHCWSWGVLSCRETSGKLLMFFRGVVAIWEDLDASVLAAEMIVFFGHLRLTIAH